MALTALTGSTDLLRRPPSGAAPAEGLLFVLSISLLGLLISTAAYACGLPCVD